MLNFIADILASGTLILVNTAVQTAKIADA